jgi:transposase-like protein
MASKHAKRVSEEDVERIVELRLNRATYVQIATEMGMAKNTVMDHWHKWLDRTTEERRAKLEQHRSEVIARLDSVATLARRGAIRARANRDLEPAERTKAEARYLAEERQAMRELSRIAGFDAPTQIRTTFVPEMSEAEADAILSALPD